MAFSHKLTFHLPVLAIIRQFSRLRVESDVAFIQLRPKVDTNLVFAVNDGNAMDRFAIGIDNREESMTRASNWYTPCSVEIVSSSSEDIRSDEDAQEPRLDR